MSHTMTLELPSEIYEAVTRAASIKGLHPAEWIVANLRQQFISSPRLPPGDSSGFERGSARFVGRCGCVGENDLWIAATALALGATLVTRDTDFQSVD